ncbi:hypothetical protein AYO44_09715 [Planctomycetaceae bacterium SCGC AG-212-F19]|nr:hypothetical protein AYO44_09715 [Planctomycetaceae bacterium SCGC AG-212-F19]
MKKIANWLLSAAATAALLGQGTASAQQPAAMPTSPAVQMATSPVIIGYDSPAEDCRCGGIVGGVELWLVKPYFGDGVKHVIHANQVTTAVNSFLPNQPLGQIEPAHQIGVAPLVWLGYEGANGLGARIRWWSMDNHAGIQYMDIGNNPFNGDGSETGFFAVQRTIAADTFDGEVTKTFDFAGLRWTGSAGLRYGQLKTTVDFFNYTATNGGQEGTDNGSIQSSKVDFRGWGPTIALDGRYAIGGGPVALVGCGRASLLYGSNHATLLNADIVASNATFGAGRDVNGVDPPNFHEVKFGEDLVPVLEIQAGVEVAQTWRGAEFFVRATLEAMVWVDGTEASLAGPARLLRFEPLDTFPLKLNDSLGLFGANISIGIRR